MKKIYYLIAMAFMALTFTSCEDVPEPYGQPVSPKKAVVDPEGSGSVSDPYNVAGAIAKCKEIGDAVSSEKFYVKGYAATEGKADADYGNASFYLSDFKDGSGKRFYAYQVTGSDGQKMKDGYTIKVGDEVVIYGPMYNYNNKTPETASKGAAYIVTVNGQKTENAGGDAPAGDAKGTGTQSDPFNVAAAITKCKEIGTTASTDKYYVKGYVVKGVTVSGGYGNVSFDMADSKDGGAIFKAFQVTGTDGEKLKDGYEVKAGSEVVVYGPMYNYQGNTPETAGKSAAQIVTIDGKKTSESGGGGETPSGEIKTATVAEFTAAAESTDVWYQLTGTVTHLEDGTYNNSTKYGNFDLVDESGSVYVYGVVSEKGGTKGKFAELMASKGIKDGCKITIIGNRGSYNGTVQVANAYFVKVEGGSSGGGTSDATYFEEPFETGQGNFTIDNKNLGEGLTFVWKHDSSNKYMKASGYASANKESESWLISPTIDLSSATNPTLTFAQVINKYFGTVANEAMVYVKKDGGEWTKVDITFPTIASGNWSKFTDEGANQSINLSSFKSSKTQFAFVYKSSTSAAGTWEIKTVKVAEAK